MKLSTVLLTTVIVLVGLGACAEQDAAVEEVRVGEQTDDPVTAFLRSSDKVELFVEGRPRSPRKDRPVRVLQTKAEIQAFLTPLVLKPKKACQCDHIHMLKFWHGKDVLIASVCSHCFDTIDDHGLIPGDRVLRFHMPQELWAKFSQYEKEHKAKQDDGP